MNPPADITIRARDIHREQDRLAMEAFFRERTGPDPVLYGYADLCSCAQHQLAKQTANKLYRRSTGAWDKIVQMVSGDAVFDAKKFGAILDNAESVDAELVNIRRGMMRCCAAW
jgi:hypothetical protein